MYFKAIRMILTYTVIADLLSSQRERVGMHDSDEMRQSCYFFIASNKPLLYVFFAKNASYSVTKN